MTDRGRMRHERLPIVLVQGDHRQIKVHPVRVLRRELVDLGHVHVADRDHVQALVGVLEEVLQPLHRLRVEEQVGPLHVLVPAPHPQIPLACRLLADVVEDEVPVLLGRLAGLFGLAVAMVDLVTERTLHRTGLADADGNLPLLHFFDEDVAGIGRALVGQPGIRRDDRNFSCHSTRTLPACTRDPQVGARRAVPLQCSSCPCPADCAPTLLIAPLPCSSCPYSDPNSWERFVAASTASISEARRRPCSSACKPAMVVPPGEATLSFSLPRCSPVSRTIRAEPSTVCVARARAPSRGKPILTPPSASAPMSRKINARP